MKSVLMKMDVEVAAGLSGIQGVAVDEEGKQRQEGAGFSIVRWLDKSTVEVWVQADDALVDGVVAEPEKKLDVSGLCKVNATLQKPVLVEKLKGWPVEVVKDESPTEPKEVIPVEKPVLVVTK